MYEPARHMRVGRIIRERSRNREDLRRVVAAHMPLQEAHWVLDLGCGYGQFYEVLEGALPGNLRVVGVDGNGENEPHFLRRIQATGAAGQFVRRQLPHALKFPSESFDVVLAFFSLYFFVEMLPEIRRLLRPDGLFVAVTHCRDSFRELNALVGDERLFEILDNFHDGNGGEVLAPWFSRVEPHYYRNALQFDPQTVEDLHFYLDFKRPLWMDRRQTEAIKARAGAIARDRGLTITKNDVIFCCRP